jgi:hypothetical protein
MNETVQGLEDSKGMGKIRLLYPGYKIKLKTMRSMPDYYFGFRRTELKCQAGSQLLRGHKERFGKSSLDPRRP